MKKAIGIDLGGTNVKGVLINEQGDILTQHHIPTHDDGDGKWRGNVLKMVEHLMAFGLHSVDVIGLSAPGLPNAENNCIAFMPDRLTGLENFVWADYFDYPTYVINDAHAATMAEARFGAAKGFQNVILLTLGTGVGGGLLINGELYQGLSQMAGHLGHIAINVDDDEASILGIPGSLEYAMGNYSLKRRSKGRFSSTHDLLDAYQKGDVYATWLWLDAVRKLAVSISSMINVLSPQMVVIAGGIALAGENLFKPLGTFMDLYEFRPAGKKTLIRQTHFGDLAGAIGAAGFALSRLKKIQ